MHSAPLNRPIACLYCYNIIAIITISKSVSLSLRSNLSLHAFHNFLSFAMWLQLGPKYRIKSLHHLVLGQPWDLLCPWGIHSVTDCPFVVISHCHVTRPYVLAFSYVPDNVCHTTLFPNPVCTLSVLEGDQFFKLGIAKRPRLTAICHYWEYTFVKCFPLQSHWHIFVSHDVVQLTECTLFLSDSPFHFLYLVMVLSHHLPKIYITVDLLDLLFINNPIILVDMLVTHYFSLPQIYLKAYWLADIMNILKHFLYHWCGVGYEDYIIGKKRWDKYSPSILTPLLSQLILLMMAHCRHDVNSLGEMLSPCLAPLPSLNFSLSLWSRRTDVALL